MVETCACWDTPVCVVQIDLARAYDSARHTNAANSTLRRPVPIPVLVKYPGHHSISIVLEAWNFGDRQSRSHMRGEARTDIRCRQWSFGGSSNRRAASSHQHWRRTTRVSLSTIEDMMGRPHACVCRQQRSSRSNGSRRMRGRGPPGRLDGAAPEIHSDEDPGPESGPSRPQANRGPLQSRETSQSLAFVGISSARISGRDSALDVRRTHQPFEDASA